MVTIVSSLSVVDTDLPKWQPISLNTVNTVIHGGDDSTTTRLVFGLTPPTVALIALAIFFCILVEILGKKQPSTSSSPSSSDLEYPAAVVDHHQMQPIAKCQQPALTKAKPSNYKKRAFFSQMLGFEMICSFVLKGVLDFEKAAVVVEGNL